MKLFVFAALVAVAASARLEHLEQRAYLPPHQGGSPAGSSFGSNGAFGSNHGSHGSNSGFGSADQGHNAGGSFGQAASNKYLPPNHGSQATLNKYLPPHHGPSASNGGSQFSGSLQGFGSQNQQGQQYSGHQAVPSQQYAIPSTLYGTPQVSNNFGAQSYQSQYSQQQSAASRQYLAPRNTPQNPPQQSFDEETGYHY